MFSKTVLYLIIFGILAIYTPLSLALNLSLSRKSALRYIFYSATAFGTNMSCSKFVTTFGPKNGEINFLASEGMPVMDESLSKKLKSLAFSEMIVFDKDGTLSDCTASLRKWVHHMRGKLVNELARFKSDEEILSDLNTFYLTFGWDAAKDDVVPSAPLAAGTWEEQVKNAMLLFEKFKIDPINAQLWHEEMGTLHANDPPVVDNLKEMIFECRKLGLLVAICTSDDRRTTDKALSNLGLTDIIDYSICGDEVEFSKPSAQPLQLLCDQANVLPSNCIVVGDTTSDTGMARNAGAGLSVGVLTGSGTRDQLLMSGADVILPDVGYIPNLLRENVPYREKRSDDILTRSKSI